MLGLLASAALVLVGIDAYLSYRRMKKYGTIVEYNSLARVIAEDKGPKVAVAFLVAWNLAAIGICVKYNLSNLLSMLVGAKLTLALVQVKSMQLETFIDKLFAAKQADRGSPPGPKVA